MSPPGTGRSKHLGRKVLMVGNVFGRDLSEDFYMIMPKLLHGLVRLGSNLQVFHDREMARGPTAPVRSAAGRAAANPKHLKACRTHSPAPPLLGHCAVINNETLDTTQPEQRGRPLAHLETTTIPP